MAAASAQEKVKNLAARLFGSAATFPTAWKEGGEAQVWMSHGDHAVDPEYDVIGVSDGAYAALTQNPANLCGTVPS